MKKHFLTISILCSIAATMQAQIIVTSTSATTQKQKKATIYRGDVSLSGLIGGHSSGTELSTVHGAQINDWMFIGVGCGFGGTEIYKKIYNMYTRPYDGTEPVYKKGAYSQYLITLSITLHFTLPVTIPKLESPFIETQVGGAFLYVVDADAYFNLKCGFNLYKAKIGNLQCFVGYKLIPDNWSIIKWIYSEEQQWYPINVKSYNYASHFFFGLSFEFGSGLNRIGK